MSNRIKNSFLLVMVLVLNIQCQTDKQPTEKQIIKVDFDFHQRKLEEVHDTDYDAWVVEEKKEDTKNINGVTVKLAGDFTSKWFKVGTQAPHYNRLGSDGLFTTKNLELTLSGLKPGRHTLLTYHNTFDALKDESFSAIDIYVNGALKETVSASNRAFSKIEMATSYLTFKVKNGEDVVVRFEIKSESEIPEMIINGFELDTPNLKKQAHTPYPESGDEHVVINSELNLTWQASKEAFSHKVYFGVDKTTVEEATENSEEFKGSITETNFPLSNLYSLQTYYWRVDEEDEKGNITKGNVWSFKPAQLAFKGAEGYGRFAVGGRGGKVIEVTNLNDDGPGSLKDAVNQEIGPRTIVFTISGNIELKSRLVVNQPYITIAGQTAPGEGITITRAPVGLTGNDGIIRFLKVKIGAGTTFDGMGLTGANYSIIDHCSISWTIDESFSSRGAHHITLQRTLISEALNLAGHDKYGTGAMHGYAATIGGDIGSFHHNLLSHNYGRNWSLGGGLNGDGYYAGKLDIRNNVVYNWGKRTTDGGANEVNFVNNYYKPGASTKFFHALKVQHEGVGKGKQQYYFSGNVMPGYFDEKSQEKGRTIQKSNNAIIDFETFVDEPFFESYVTTQPAKAAYKNVLSDVGATQPFFDKHDTRIIHETLNGTYSNVGSKSGFPGMVDTEEDSGGWPEFKSEKRPDNWDTDHDGLPNWWEKLHSLNENSENGDFSDTNRDVNKDGFTQLDNYLDWLSKPHYFMEINNTVSINLTELFKGYTDSPTYKILNADNISAMLNDAVVTIKSINTGLASVEIQVADAEGDSMVRTINVMVN